jgi:hypothetical protein
MLKKILWLKGLIGVLLLTNAYACGPVENSYLKERWDYYNSPDKMMDQYEVKLDALPLKAKLPYTPWTDSYWPTYKRGVAHRWQNDTFTADELEVDFTREQIQDSFVNIATDLSPIEKYDLLRGDYNFALKHRELNRTQGEAQTWEGLCHGWAPASILFYEPEPVVMTNPDGVEINFSASDVKALITYFFHSVNSPTVFLGQRCNVDLSENPDSAETNACRDTNAGAFHVILTNLVGIHQVGFVADITRDLQVWNHPVYGYEATILGEDEVYEGAAPGTVKVLKVRTTMNYVVEIGARPYALHDKDEWQLATTRYEYFLELNDQGEILGGKWITNDRPDFLWMRHPPTFDGDFKELQDLYIKSINK